MRMRLVTLSSSVVSHHWKSRVSLLVSCQKPWFESSSIEHSRWCGTCHNQFFTPAHQAPTPARRFTSAAWHATFQNRSSTTEVVSHSCCIPFLSRSVHSCTQFSTSHVVPKSLDKCFSITNKSLQLLDVRGCGVAIGSHNAKRYVGRSSQNQDDDVSNASINITNTKYRFPDRTRSLIRGRVSRLQSSLSSQKAKLREQIKSQRIRGVQAVRHLGSKLQVPREDIRTIPNLLTTMRMASAPVLAYLVVSESYGLACGLFIAAGITDMLDGYIARNFKNQTTALGMALDPLADKLLVSFLTISLTSVGLIPVPMTALILSRDVVLVAGGFCVRYMTLSPPKLPHHPNCSPRVVAPYLGFIVPFTCGIFLGCLGVLTGTMVFVLSASFQQAALRNETEQYRMRTLSRYFDVSHVTVKLHPSRISKVNTFLQLSFVASSLASPVFDFVHHPLLQALMYLTATTTVLSGADYMLTWRQRLQIVKNK